MHHYEERPDYEERLGLSNIVTGIAAAFVASSLLMSPVKAESGVEWTTYGGDLANTRYSTLKQIDTKTVKDLKVAWAFPLGVLEGQETTPLVVGGTMYVTSPKGPKFVYALDAASGKALTSFGKDGRIDLREDLDRDPAKQSIYMTSPAVIYKDLMIVGGREAETLPASFGDVRAYGVSSGELRWSFHTIPRPGEFGYETWPKEAWKTSGAANNWTGMTVDAAHGIVYVPTGSAAFDFYGGDRLGDDLFADCLIALNAETGERIWHFQGVKHDLWDRDFPAPPVFLTVDHEGKKVDAVAQTTKQGFVFLFDRANGKPLFPVECRNYPPSDVPGEVAVPQQCLPTKPAPFARQLLTENLLSDRTPQVHEWALEKFRAFRSDGQFVPFSVGKDTVVFPGFDGGAEWGGAAADPDTGILYVNANDVAWTGALAENTPSENAENTPKALYMSQCAVCHGERMAGSPPAIPSLVGIGDHKSAAEITATIRNGKGRMPGSSNLANDQIAGLLSYLANPGATKNDSKEMVTPEPEPAAMKYHFTGYRKFLDPDGYPAVAPPWGTLSAINLNTGEYVWKTPLGEYPELAAQGLRNTGTENYGGPVVTAGGLVFIGATNFDKKFRAFDKATGKLLWETTLPFAGNATPATYEVNGRQFVVIAAGGGKDLKSKSGGVYVAFALKK